MRAGEGVVRETPIITTRTLSEQAGTKVVLKAENLQGTGSFKLRGAMSKLSALGERGARGRVRQRRQPRAGGRLRGAGAGRALRGVHAGGGADRQGRRGQALGATLHLAGRSVDEASPPQGHGRPRRAWSSSTRSTIRT